MLRSASQRPPGRRADGTSEWDSLCTDIAFTRKSRRIDRVRDRSAQRARVTRLADL
jgi:hypothetical protein